ncbi:MAG: PAS domain-containing sensor histidine kinase [Bryobacteraceae bacterium]
MLARKTISRYVWLPAALALPVVLLASSLLTYRELGEMQAIYLRNNAAAVAARLEVTPPDALDSLYAEAPGLIEIAVFDRETSPPGDPALEAIWSGRQLFRTEETRVDGERVFRAWVPFHSGARLRVARIDLAASSAAFLVQHAGHNLVVASVAGLTLTGLSLFAMRAVRRGAQLERLAELGKMSAVMAHEIRNPLGAVKGFVQLAAEKAGPDVNAMLEPALDETRRLERLVNDLLLYGRPPAPSPRRMAWAPLANSLENHARQFAAGRPLGFAATGEEWTLESDPDLLKQALLNLVKNAVEASDSPQIRLTLAPHGSGAVIAVEDNGPGIPQGVRLFEPFQTTKASGAGLGLSIAHKLVESLRGRLVLRNLAAGGARAEILLPHARLEKNDGNDPGRG